MTEKAIPEQLTPQRITEQAPGVRDQTDQEHTERRHTDQKQAEQKQAEQKQAEQEQAAQEQTAQKQAARIRADRRQRAANDVHLAVSLAAETLRPAAGKDWHLPAAGLSWSCRETIEHIADDLFAYAGQIAADSTPATGYVPFGWRHIRPDGPALTVFVEDQKDTEGLVQVLEASGGLLSAVVTVAPADRLAFHPYGVSDPEGFAAMGVVETLVHMHDVAEGLGLPWSPPEDLCDRALRRLFREAPEHGDRWRVLLWATGRADLPGLPRRTQWRWDGTPGEGTAT